MASSKISAYSTATVATNRTGKTGCSAATAKITKPDLLDNFRDPKVCEILATSDELKPDIFDVLRPKPRTVLGYNISQTDIKGQRTQPMGITKLHIQQTTAHYEIPPPGYTFPVEEPPPPPPPEPIIQYSTGRGPLKEFIEDKWRRNVEKEQHVSVKRLADFITATRKYDKEKLAREHEKLMKLVGPDWFQELSPNQLRTIDNLKNCIVKDVKLKTTCNTQINMAQLGLVLRPNPQHIKIALKKCCECPVEFLLILYQLLNKHRTEYSLNDRLLLSAVVHLTMRETLKELHIRIPSPPPPLKKEIPIKKKKRKRYKSPYLVPFTFKPEKPKHTGIYKNNYIQYPDSPYFSYISELKSEICKEKIEEVEDEDDEEAQEEDEDKLENKKKKVGNVKKGSEKTGEEEKKAIKIMITKKQSGITDVQEKELIGELKVAQREYNALADYEPVPFLHKPSIYIPCDHGLKKKMKDAEEEEEEVDSSSDNETNATVSVEVRVTTDFDQYCQPIRKVCECKITFDEAKVPKHPLLENISSSSDTGVESENKHEDERKNKDLAKPSDDIVVVKKPVKVEIEKKTIAVSTASRDDVVQKKSEKFTYMEELTKKKSKPTTTLKLEPPELETDEKLVTLGQRESSECKCKEEVEKIIETNLCQCDRCKADRAAVEQRKKPTYIISGTQVQIQQEEAEKEDTQVVSVISGVKAKKTCDCLQKFQAKVKMYEEMKKRFDAQHNLKTLDQQYIIGGVTHSPDGEPVYMLSGVIPQRECPCAEIYQEQVKEQQRLANMPKIPLGRQKYIISGVHETEQGNVYIVSGAAAIDDCPCMKMYKSYESKHLPCLKMYEDYLKKIEMDTEEYMSEIATDPRFTNVEELIQPTSKSEDETTKDVVLDNIEEPSGASEQRVSQDSAKPQEIDRVISGGFVRNSNNEAQKQTESENKSKPEKNASQTKQVCRCGVIEEEDICNIKGDLLIETDLNLTLEINNDYTKKKAKDKEKTLCICEPDYTACICKRIDLSECDCGYNSDELESEESVEPLLKRFIIMEKIPCQPSKQIEILKQALEVLAEDGFPLAKFPDSYKLPHFKLWMQLRCGKFWPQEVREPMLMQSCGHWRHYGYCGRKVRLPKLEISNNGHNYTWANAKFVRKMATEADALFYRKIRQANIGDGREFFPSTFSYELPTPTFRDCYFAYTAPKEEDCVCWRPWYLREVKNFKNRKSCL